MSKSILITGGAGFIGSHVVREFVLKSKNYKIFNLDSLTYAGNLENLNDIDFLPITNLLRRYQMTQLLSTIYFKSINLICNTFSC